MERRFIIEATGLPNLPGMMLATVEALREIGGSATLAHEAGEPLHETACAIALRDAAPLLTIYFENGGSVLTTESIAKINTFTTMFKLCPDVIVHVTGHSDTTGDEIANLVLSWQRADAVVSMMAALCTEDEFIDALGFGTRKSGKSGDAANERDRRAEFHVLDRH